MKEVEAGSESLGVMGTLEQMAQVLGFHDLSSFFMVGIFLVVALAFVVSCAIFLIKKRRERLEELHKIVTEVQKIEEPKPVVLPTPVKPEPVVPAPIKPVVKKEVIKPKPPKTPEPLKAKPAVKAVVEKKVEKPQELPRIEPAFVEEIVSLPPLPAIPEEAPVVVPPSTRSQLGAALKNTRGGFIEKLSRLFSRGKEMSDEDFEEIESILFTADIGVKTAQKLLDVLRDRVRAEKNADKTFLRSVLKE